MSTDRTPDIDYGALHLAFDAAFQSFGAEHYSYDAAELAGIRAVVAAYVAQQRARGVVEVRAEDIEPLLLYVDDGVVLDRLTTATALPAEDSAP